MSWEPLENALAWAKRRVTEFEEYEKERLRRDEEEGCRTHISVFNRMCHWDVTFYEIELELRKRRALNEDRLSLHKELHKVRCERQYDREAFLSHSREARLWELPRFFRRSVSVEKVCWAYFSSRKRSAS